MVECVNPVMGGNSKANIAYDKRGLPIMDDVSASTQKTDTTKSYAGQMVQATKDLWSETKGIPSELSRFTTGQLKAIEAGRRTIPGFRWHHNAQSAPNNMQLIPKAVNNSVQHIGQGSISQGK